MPAKKKATAKKPAKPKLCLRKIDRNTVMMSDDPKFPEASDTEKSEKLPKGMHRVDPHTVVKV